MSMKMKLKKIVMSILCMVLLCSLTACSSPQKEESNNDISVTTDTDITESTTQDTTTSDGVSAEDGSEDAGTSGSESDANILIAYFSWSGNSKAEAELIQEKTGGTLFEIAREEAYPEDYTECTEVAKKETDDNARPAIKNPLESVAEYDKIVLCYPIWWHTVPMCVGTFLESYDLSGKTIYPVSQSASMDEDQFTQSVDFVKDCAKGADVQEGLFAEFGDEGAITEYVEGSILK